MKITTYVLLVGLGLPSFSQTRMIVGNYLSTYPYNQSLTLGDSTFLYYYHDFSSYSSFPISVARGKWKKLSGDMIELTSREDSGNFPIEVNERHIERLDSIEFRIKEPDSLAIKKFEYALLLDNVEVAKQTDPQIKVSASEGKFNTMRIHVTFERDSLWTVGSIRYDETTERYRRKSSESNCFEITIPFEQCLTYREKISGDTLLVTGNRLFWERKGETYFEKTEKHLRHR